MLLKGSIEKYYEEEKNKGLFAYVNVFHYKISVCNKKKTGMIFHV
jgi:hypothetical protein